MSRYVMGQGVLSIGVPDATTKVPEDFVEVGNVPDGGFTVTFESNKFEHTESMTGQRKTDLVIFTDLKGSFNLTLEDITAENLAVGLRGTVTTATNVSTVHVGAADQAFKSLKFVGVNQIDGSAMEVLIYKCLFSPAKNLSFLTPNSELFKLELDGAVLYEEVLDTGGTIGGFMEIKVPSTVQT